MTRARRRLARAAALGLAILTSAGPAAAGAIVDPTDTLGAGRVRLDGTGVGVFTREIRLEESDRIVDTSGRTFAIGGAFGLLDGLDGFLTVGATRLALDEDDALPSGDFDGDVGFAFGGGLRYRFVDERYFKVGSSVSISRNESAKGDVEATWIDGEFLLGASLHAFRDVVPFAGLSIGIIRGQFDGPFGRIDFRQENVVGAMAGLRYAATSQVEATLAGRLFDREEVSFALSFGF
ncbi:MAG TPA: hypothetical protein VIM86_04965 [Thermodesulfobacteriota bacterium]